MLAASFIFSDYVRAQVCDPAQIIFAPVDENGKSIPKIKFEVYEQLVDVNGKAKPGEKKASGEVNETLGSGKVQIKLATGVNKKFALKVYDKNSKVGEFWIYDQIQLSCGTKIEVTKVLSAIKFSFYDVDGDLQKNTQFSIYTQRQDANGFPIKEKQDLIYTANTSEEGEFVYYLASREESIDGESDGVYLIEIKKGTDQYVKYDLEVSSEETLDVVYALSHMKIILRDSNTNVYPAGTKIEIYDQSYSSGNVQILGNKLKDVYTDNQGVAIFNYKEGLYVARVKNLGGEYENFWELEIVDGLENEYDLMTSANWEPEAASCKKNSIFNLVAKRLDGSAIPNLNYEIYEQIIGSNGNPEAGKRVVSKKIDANGKGQHEFKPMSGKKYVLKIYDKNANSGEFWYYNEIQFDCDSTVSLTKYLPALNVIFRDLNGNLKKNQSFSLYAQKVDVDGIPAKEKSGLISKKITTDDSGQATIFVAPAHLYKKNKSGLYAIESTENKEIFSKYNISISPASDTLVEYYFSDAVLTVKNQNGKDFSNKKINVYQQAKKSNGENALGDKIGSFALDQSGVIRIVYPQGRYAVTVEDDLNQPNVFWNINIRDGQRTNKILNMGLVNVSVSSSAKESKSSSFDLYRLVEGSDGLFYQDKKIQTIKTGLSNFISLNLAEGPYLFVLKYEQDEYGTAAYINNEQNRDIVLKVTRTNRLKEKSYKLQKPIQVNDFAKKLAGKILLQVEQKGEAWYVNPKNNKKYYLQNGETAYRIMKNLGLGISNADLNKIPVGYDEKFNDQDQDLDGLADKLEEALGTNANKPDSDQDGYVDGVEVEYGYNPLGSGKSKFDSKMQEKIKGHIVLQTESRGEAWYINPANGKRYYMRNGEQAYQVMKYLSIGIKDDDLEKIEEESIE